MRCFIAIILLMFYVPSLQAASVLSPNEITLSKAPINRSDMVSIKRGAKFFAANCMSCHTLVYLQYDEIAKAAGITIDKMPLHITSWPYGIKPPDLSLEANVRGVDWLYTYLHSFYQDSSRPTGVNNLLMPNTAMPGVMLILQGQQIVEHGPFDVGVFNKSIYWYNQLTLIDSGSMSSSQFDESVTDLVNFLAYAAEPYHKKQHAVGMAVLGFFLVMFLLAYLLKKEYWKDVEKLRNK